MKKIIEKTIVLTLIFLMSLTSGCSNDTSQDEINDMSDEIEKIRIEVVKESILKDGISYSLKLINNSNHVIVQNNVYIGFPVTNKEKSIWSSSDWKVEAKGNKLNIEPGQEIPLNAYLSDEFFKYNELICLDRPEVEIKGYLDNMNSMNQFHKGGSIHSFDSNFKSKLEDVQHLVDETDPDQNSSVIDEDYVKSIKDSYDKIGYMYYLKTNLMLGMTKDEVLELVDFEYIEVLPGMGDSEMWRFDIMKDVEYAFDIDPVIDSLDMEGLKEEEVKIVLFISWNGKEKLEKFTFYYKEPVDGSINEYRVFDTGTIRESVISE
jgi:hypothetical protein